MAETINVPLATKVVTFSAITTTTTSKFSLPVGDSYSFCTFVQTAGTTSLDVCFQTSTDGGTTYQNLPLRHTQFTTTTGVMWITFKLGIGMNEIAAESGYVALTGGTLAKNCVFDPAHMAVVLTTSGTSWTGSITAFIQPASHQGS